MHNNYYPTPHVLEKMTARDVTWGEILDVINQPEVVYYTHGGVRKVHQGEKIAVVTAVKDRAVITVLLRSYEQWTDEDVRARK